MLETPSSSPAPLVWRWYIVYCVSMAILYIIVVIAGIVLLLLDPALLAEEALVLRVQGVLFFGIGIVLFIPFAAAPFLPKKPWVWIYGIVLIALGMTSACCLPATIPLLIFWIKPEAQQFFGRK